jgi:hypothetical protein
MGQSTGKITFINTDDYVSDIDGVHYAGCTASLKTDDGTDVIVYTESMRLQHTIEMAFATECDVTVDYMDIKTPISEQRPLGKRSADRDPSRDTLGAFNLNAMWTVP